VTKVPKVMMADIDASCSSRKRVCSHQHLTNLTNDVYLIDLQCNLMVRPPDQSPKHLTRKPDQCFSLPSPAEALLSG
jgi:hypothetical protein